MGDAYNVVSSELPAMKSLSRVIVSVACVGIVAMQSGCGGPELQSDSGSIEPKGPVNRADLARDGILAHLAKAARSITDRAKAETASRESWEAVREQRRAELNDMLGLDVTRPKTPLNVRITGRIARPGYVVEKIAFESIPKVYVTANLYLPTDRPGPVPAVIYVCGHAFSPHGAKTSYQRHGHTLARHGYAALVIDPIQIAETVGLHHGVYNQEMYEWYTRAYSPAGLEVWNVIRGIDFLETRPEVDAARLAITGRSGGAAMSWFAAAVEPRIKAAIPVMGIGTYAVSVPDDTQRLHCDCMYPVNFRMHDMIHLGALIAPRPLLTAHGREDPLFPVAGYEEFEAAISSLYASYDAPDRFRNLVVESGHEDSDFLRAEAVKWLDRWILDIEERPIGTEFQEIDAADLSVFGGEPPSDARNFQMHDYFVPPVPLTQWTGAVGWRRQNQALLEELRSKVLHALPINASVPVARPGSIEGPDGFEALEFDFAGEIPVEGLLRIPENADGPALLHIASPGEDPAATQRLLTDLPRFGRNPVLVVYPPGTGTAVWPKSEWKMLLRNAMQTGRSVDSIRIGSVLLAAQVLRQRAGGRSLTVSGIGPAAGWAIYAAAFDETIEHVILVRPPATHDAGPILLGAARHADLPGFAALIAPRRITFYGRMPTAFSATLRIYEGLRSGSQISESMSIAAALNGRFGHGYSIGM